MVGYSVVVLPEKIQVGFDLEQIIKFCKTQY